MESSLSLSVRSFAGEDDPWNACIQSGCEISEAGFSQPLLFSEDSLKILWAASILRKEKIKSPVSKFPFEGPFAEALLHLLGKKVPFVPRMPKNSETLSRLCQLALLWAIAGETQAALQLAEWLLHFAKEKPLFSLWCPEKKYNEHEGFLSYSLLFRFLGQKEKAASFYRETKDPFFIALAKASPILESSPSPMDSFVDPSAGLILSYGEKMTFAWTLSGHKNSLGMIRAKDVEIRAMGPQALPLSEGDRFGISSQASVNHQGWIQCYALPEVWFQMKTQSDEDYSIDFNFIGVRPEQPLAFVFYVKAESCTAGQQIFRPKSLQRYSGNADVFLFKGKESNLRIQSSPSHKVQMIPLAGEGGFWNADFLLAFEIHPFDPKATFKLNSI